MRDAGVGIPLEDQPHIFDRFTRGTAAHRSSSSGLGLAIVARIAQSHGGAVSVRSQPGHGATFVIEIPDRYEETA